MAWKEYIEREAAIKAFDDPRVERYYGDVSPESVIRIIEFMPAADVRPVVRGKWIRNARGNYNCSNCKSEHNAVFGFAFCPNCGADMREGQT